MVKRLLGLTALSLGAWLLGLMLWTVVAFTSDELNDRYWSAHGYPPSDPWNFAPLQVPLLLGPLVALWAYSGWRAFRRSLAQLQA